jgi:hypothetical protein
MALGHKLFGKGKESVFNDLIKVLETNISVEAAMKLTRATTFEIEFLRAFTAE